MRNLFKRFQKETPRTDSKKSLRIRDGCFYWGFKNIPLEVDLATRHFMVIGSTGSGKTTIMRLLLKSVLQSFKTPEAKTKRALVYDNKREYVSLVHAALRDEAKTDVFLFNPFDSRTHAWDISSDVTTARHANSIANILIPPDGSSQPFFTDAARAVLSAVMTVFAKLKEADNRSWSLRDVIMALRSKERIQLVVSIYPEVQEMVLPFLEDYEAFPSVLSTIASKMAPFEVVAARFEQARAAGRVLSLSDWLKSESILILGSSPANRASLDPINRVIFRRLFDLMLDQENQRENLTWVFLDELREAGKIDGLSSLLNQGRSKGISVVIGFQEIEGMIQEYGPNVSAEIFGQCAYKSFLRTGSASTASWVEHYWGMTQMMDVSYNNSVTHSKDGTSVTSGVSYAKQSHQAVLASTLMQFPPTGPRSGVLAGYHDIPGRAPEELYAPWDRIQTLLSPDEKRRQDLPPEKQNECKWADQSSSSEVVWPWTKQELARLMRFSTRKGSPDETDLGQTFLNFSPKKKDGEEESRAEEKVAPPKHPEAKTTKPEEEETPAKEDSDKKEGRTQLPQRRIGR